jgi:hypothetical protein
LIVESAFLKIPEILLSHKEPDLLYEANITNLFTNGIILELNARNIDNPMRKIYMEKRYKSNINARCDVFLDFSSFINKNDFYGYSISSKSWVEAKYFGGINRNSGHETKSENAGSIIYDIFRLIWFTHLEGNIGDAKYSLNVFNDCPTKYLAFFRQDRKKRQWINALTSCGINQLHFDLEDEPNSIRKIFKNINSLVMDIKLRNLVFEPIQVLNDRICFYGYLNQIIEYNIKINNNEYSGG